MGEASRRAKTESSFGRIPKSVREQPRGIVLSPPVTVQGNSLFIKNSDLDPQELRMSLLYFDELLLPQNNVIYMETGPDLIVLIEQSVLKTKKVLYQGSGDMAEIFANMHIQTFRQLDAQEPGKWSLATGENSFNWDCLPAGTVDGYKLDLLSAIPVPDKEVPFAEILEFKLKRKDELLALRVELDNLGSRIIASGNAENEIKICGLYIQKACTDLLITGKEWRFPIRIADAKCSFEVNVGQLVGAAGLGAMVAQSFAMPTVGALIGGALSALKITADLKRQPVMPRSSPYQYVYSFHNELY